MLPPTHPIFCSLRSVLCSDDMLWPMAPSHPRGVHRPMHWRASRGDSSALVDILTNADLKQTERITRSDKIFTLTWLTWLPEIRLRNYIHWSKSKLRRSRRPTSWVSKVKCHFHFASSLHLFIWSSYSVESTLWHSYDRSLWSATVQQYTGQCLF